MAHQIWRVEAYGRTFLDTSAEGAMAKADWYGERYQLRAESLIAYRTVVPEASFIVIERISDTCVHAY